jgi:hypothetical protein
MNYDPWDWTKDNKPLAPVPQTNNTLQVPASGQAQAPGSIPGQPSLLDYATNVAMYRGVDRGLNYGEKKIGEAMATTPSAPLSQAGTASSADLALASSASADAAGVIAADTAAATAAAEGAAAGSALASGGAAAGTGAAAGAGAAEAGALAGMGPVGWGIGAFLLAKQMKWI